MKSPKVPWHCWRHSRKGARERGPNRRHPKHCGHPHGSSAEVSRRRSIIRLLFNMRLLDTVRSFCNTATMTNIYPKKCKQELQSVVCSLEIIDEAVSGRGTDISSAGVCNTIVDSPLTSAYLGEHIRTSGVTLDLGHTNRWFTTEEKELRDVFPEIALWSKAPRSFKCINLVIWTPSTTAKLSQATAVPRSWKRAFRNPNSSPLFAPDQRETHNWEGVNLALYERGTYIQKV